MELGKRNMFPCILQLLFLVVELTGILISLGKSMGWKGSLFRLESGLSGARFQRRNSESLESDGSLCLQVSGSQSSPVRLGGNMTLCMPWCWLSLTGSQSLLTLWCRGALQNIFCSAAQALACWLLMLSLELTGQDTYSSVDLKVQTKYRKLWIRNPTQALADLCCYRYHA